MKQLYILCLLFGLSMPAAAGPGHDHGEGAFASGAGPAENFELTTQQMQTLDIRTAKVVFMPIQDTVDMLAFTELLPENKATISPRFGGKIVKINVTVGQEVKKGQPIVTLEPISVGSKKVVLSAPISGFIVRLPAGVGEIIEPGGTIMEIGDPRKMLVRGVMYETPDIAKIRVGQQAEIHLDIAPDHHIQGKIQRINRVINQDTRTFSVYALIETPDQDVQPGLQGIMEVFTGNNLPVMAIPKRAILGELGSRFVYVIKDRSIEKREIVSGLESGHHVAIKSGLFPNEMVVTQGNYQLQYITVGGVQSHDHDHGGEHDDEHEHNHDHDHE